MSNSATPPTGETRCRKCGATLFGAEESCAACLLETGLEESGEDAVALGDFEDYELLEEIGRGGQGVVYRARQKSLNRVVALKIIGLGRWASTPHLRRFRQEAEAAARLEHSQIVPIYEIGEGEGSCYFSMKFIEGGPLDEFVRRKPLSVRRAAELLAQIARTVQFAHEHGILHRDIKPGNVLLDRAGQPHLTDFGLARLIENQSTVTNSFDVLGTPSYMAPEQAGGETKNVTAAADVYSLGAVFYHLLTGEPPFAGGTTYETIRQVLEREARDPRQRNPKVDADVATICLKCLDKEPAKRYPSAAALADDLERWLRYEPIRARRTSMLGRTGRWIRRNPAQTVAAAALIGLLVAVGVLIEKSDLFGNRLGKGIAVLPFANLSGDQSDSVFADGIQDDILTKLAKVGALKVISRTSVMPYRGARDIPQIGQMLQVSYVLEGSVRRSANRIHLNAQLINARTNANVWAEEFDRDLIDTFAIQSEVARKVAEQMHARLTADERKSIERAPTADLTAFDLYTRAKNIFLRVSFSNRSREDLLEAANLLDQAVTRDPSFFQAYCQLVFVHDFLYLVGHDHTPARLATADSALRAAFRLRPEAGEAHLAKAENLYRGHLDYAGALGELEKAQDGLPNESRIFELRGYIQRRQGRHEAALRSLQRALELDPRNLFCLQQLANGYILLQRFAEAKATAERALVFEPNDLDSRGAAAWIEFEWKADARPLQRVVDEAKTAAAPLSRIADAWLLCALAERDMEEARAALAASDQNSVFSDEAIHFSRAFVEGMIARMAHDEMGARNAFTIARVDETQAVRAQPDYPLGHCVLGLIDAELGLKEEALREGRRAVELAPVERDGLNGPLAQKYLALIAAWLGEKELACDQLEVCLRNHGPVTYGYLKKIPLWDPLRGYPRYEKIVASLAPP